MSSRERVHLRSVGRAGSFGDKYVASLRGHQASLAIDERGRWYVSEENAGIIADRLPDVEAAAAAFEAFVLRRERTMQSEGYARRFNRYVERLGRRSRRGRL